MSELEKKRSETPQQAEAPFKSGEKGFAVFWLLFGGFFFAQSLQLYQKHPGLDSCAALPLFVTGVIVLCSIINLIGDRAITSLRKAECVERQHGCLLITDYKKLKQVAGDLVGR